MAFAGKLCVISGGSGNVGSAVIQTLLRGRATVVAPVRSEKSKATLMEDLADSPTETLTVPLVDVGTEDGSVKLAEFLRKEHGPIDYVVSSLGGWWQKGPLLDQPLTEMEDMIHNLGLSHATFAKAVVPLMRDSLDSGYVIITGGTGGMYMVPNTSLVTIGVGVAWGISMSLRAELADRAYRVNEVRLKATVVRPANLEATKKTSPFPVFSSLAFAAKIVETLTDVTKKGEVVTIMPADLEAVSEAV